MDAQSEDRMFTIATNTGKLYSIELSSLNFSQGKRTKTFVLNSINTTFSNFKLSVPLCRELILVMDFRGQYVRALYNISTGESLPFWDDTMEEDSYGCSLPFWVDIMEED